MAHLSTLALLLGFKFFDSCLFLTHAFKMLWLLTDFDSSIQNSSSLPGIKPRSIFENTAFPAYSCVLQGILISTATALLGHH